MIASGRGAGHKTCWSLDISQLVPSFQYTRNSGNMTNDKCPVINDQ
jgi:hypothetical protein